MEKIKLTKNALKKHRDELKRYYRYLPTLNIKKQQLQKEVLRVRAERAALTASLDALLDNISPWLGLLAHNTASSHLPRLADIVTLYAIHTTTDNIAGVDIPVFLDAAITVKDYDLFLTPLWLDAAVEAAVQLITLTARQGILKEQELRLAEELLITSQRVNLFEKIKIPQAQEAVRAISISLGDQQTTAVGWARLAKKKIAQAGGSHR